MILRQPRRLVGLLGAVLLLSSSGCKKQEDLRGDENVKVMVAKDRKLAEQENKLLATRGTLQRERSRMRDKRTALLSRKLALSAEDSTGREKLEREESKLVTLETKLAGQEVQLNQRLQQLLEQKSSLAGKASGSAKESMLRRREYALALREKDLARREKGLASREKQLAGREQSFAVRQAKICPRAATTTVIQRVADRRPGDRSYSRRDVEPVYRAALNAMRTKGLLVADLPAGIDRLVTETRHAVSKKDFSRAKFAADQLLASVRRIRIDRSFIGAKISRLSSTLKRRPAPAKHRTKVAMLFQQATASYGDGRFRDANRKLNKIYGLLR